ncbi:metabotropic glutamate receptor-like protein P isoform X3 [Octopus bimaculoides]|uniref:metabotropic glutamate receptor-like protein P isoform X3 n=1 Tax=Octopus bimaculoides TaxID=37653 RepID=UPI0022E0A694|nr:metabotropic glutamate receptor-like protein P isoform X3 [Octopus bimaculoides]
MSLNCSRIFIKMLILSLLLAVLDFSESSTGALTATRYMLSYCKHHIKTLQLNGSLVLELSNNVLGSRRDVNYEHCELKVRVESSKHILLQFFRLEIADTHGTPDRLKVFDNLPDMSVLLTPKHGAYGYFPGGIHRGVRDYNSTYNELKLNYFGQPTRNAPGFKLLLTPFKREIARNKCPEGYFHCSIRHICIDSSLACDGYPNCGSKDESDEGKCSYYAEAQKSTSFFQGPTLLVFVVCVVAIIAFLGITLVICLLTRYFNNDFVINSRCYISSIMKLRQAKRKRRRTQEYTSTNDLTQSYDPPSYEDVVRRRSADPPSYNITTPDTEDEASGAGGGSGSSNDKLVNNRRLRNNNVNTKNINIYNNTHSKNNANHTNNMPSTQPRNEYENLVRSGNDHHGEEEQPLRSSGDHVYSCSVMIESPVSSSRARYSHRINSSNRNSSCSNSSSSNNMSDSNEFLLDTNGGSRGGADVLAPRLSNGGDVNSDEKLNGAVGCSPMATSRPGLYPAAVMPPATDSSITPPTASSTAATAATTAAASVPSGAAVVLNGTHNDNFNPRRSYPTTAAIGNDSESCDDDDDDSFSQHGNLLSNIENFCFADMEPSPQHSTKKSSSNRNSNNYDNSNNIFCDLNSVNFNTDNNNKRGSGDSVSGGRNGIEAKISPGIANGIGEVNGTKNDIVTPRTNEEGGGGGGGGMMKMHRNRAVEESELVTPQPESVRLLQ